MVSVQETSWVPTLPADDAASSGLTEPHTLAEG